MDNLAQAQQIKQYTDVRHFDEPSEDITLIITELYNPVKNEFEYYAHLKDYGKITFLYGLEGEKFPKMINHDEFIESLKADGWLNIDYLKNY